MRMAIAIAGALLLVAASARATDDKAQSTSAKTSSSATDTAKSTAEAVTGSVKSTDPAAMTITVALPTGVEQQVNVDKDAKIQRDGSMASFAQIQPGDSVRASLDPKSHKASELDVKSKGALPSKSDSQPKPKENK